MTRDWRRLCQSPVIAAMPCLANPLPVDRRDLRGKTKPCEGHGPWVIGHSFEITKQMNTQKPLEFPQQDREERLPLRVEHKYLMNWLRCPKLKYLVPDPSAIYLSIHLPIDWRLAHGKELIRDPQRHFRFRYRNQFNEYRRKDDVLVQKGFASIVDGHRRASHHHRLGVLTPSSCRQPSENISQTGVAKLGQRTPPNHSRTVQPLPSPEPCPNRSRTVPNSPTVFAKDPRCPLTGP